MQGSNLTAAIHKALEADKKDVKGKEFTRLLKEGIFKLKKKHKAEMQEMIDDLHRKVFGHAP